MAHPLSETLTQWITGTLDPVASAEVEAHLERCLHCEDTVSQLESQQRTSIQWIREAGASVTSESLANVAEQMPQRLGPYQLQGELGRGGMGTVYRAVHERLEKVVAIKMLPPDRTNDPALVARFHREMKAVGRVEHPNIVRATDAGEIDGTLFLVMEYVDGEDLAAIQRRIGRLPVADACESVRQAAIALEEAAAHGMIHRDVKPSNLMVARSRTGPAVVKLLDLGLARLGAEQTHELTSTGQIMGSIDYMSPEQCDDTRGVDIRADIYSLGATLYRLLSGQTLFGGRAELGLLQKLNAIATKSPRPIGEICGGLPEGLPELIDSMLDKLPENRPSTPAEVADRIAAFTEGNDLHALLALSKVAAHAWNESTIQALQHHPTDDIARAGEAVTQSQFESAALVRAHEPIKSAKPEPSEFQKSPWRRSMFASGLVGAMMIVAGIVFVLPTRDGGTIRFEVNDPAIKIAFADRVYTIDDAGKEYRIAEGDHRLRVSYEDVEFETAELLLGTGERARLKVSYEDSAIEIDRDGKVQMLAPIADAPITNPNSGKADAMDMPSDLPAIAFDSELPGDALPKEADITVATVTYGMFLDKSVTMEIWVRRNPENLAVWRFMGLADLVMMESAGDHHRPVDLRWEGGFIGSDHPYNQVVEGWHHLAAVRDRQQREHRFYVNGQRMKRVPFDGEPYMPPETHGEPLIFAYGYTGHLGPARVSSIARYDEDFVPLKRFETDPDTIAIYNLEETSNNKVLIDSSGNDHHGRILRGHYVSIGNSGR